MTVLPVTGEKRKEFNAVISHPLQSYEWGEFREKTGVKVIRRGFYEGPTLLSALQLTIHKIPYTRWTIGYLPKGTMPTKEHIHELKKISIQEQCIFIQLEPNIPSSSETISSLQALGLQPSFHPLFTKYTFQLDLTQSEEDLRKHMHPKTRYNVRIAQKHGIQIQEEHTHQAFKEYLRLTQETTKRQGFYAHTPDYHTTMWETLHKHSDGLSAVLLIAWYTPESSPPVALTAWVLFILHDTLYYPYGASSSSYREVMSSNLMMWEAILYGKKKGLKKFDMWGSLGPEASKNDPWYGFHRFKAGYGPQLLEFVGSFDLIISPQLYFLYKVANSLRWVYLKMRKGK